MTRAKTACMALLIVAAAAADVATTIYGLETSPMLYETNPYGRLVIDWGGYLGVVVAKTAVAMAAVSALAVLSHIEWYGSEHSKDALESLSASSQWVATAAVVGTWGYASINNVVLIAATA